MQYYSFTFALMVVERFIKTRSRGWALMRKNLDNFYLEDLAGIFQKNQKQWNILKKLIKYVDRNSRPNYYTDVKLRELYRYFENVQNGEDAHSLLLTRFREKIYYTRAPKS